MNEKPGFCISTFAGASVVALSMLASSAQAIPVVKNGNFQDATSPGLFLGTLNFEIPVGPQTLLKNWTVQGTPTASAFLDCLVFPGTATINVCGGGFSLWKDPGLSPDGGNVIAFDGDSTIAHSIFQDITDLVAGQLYKVSFFQAAAQLDDRTGDTTEQWEVSLGTTEPHQLSHLMKNLSKDIVPWESQTLIFKATGVTETLRFLAKGSPNGLPPFVLLDGVSIQAVPEPGTLALVGVSLLGLLLARRQQKRRG